MGASKDDESIGGVDVIVIAPRPGGGTVVVGWYRNATVFRHFQHLVHPSKKHIGNGINGYRFSALARDATLLPTDRRTFEIPRRTKGGLGTSNVWFADKVIDPDWLVKIRKLLSGGRAPSPRKSKKAAPDQVRKILVEKTAVEIVWNHFQLDYEIKSVEKDNVGWDLEAISGSIKLQIEVKGLSGNAVTTELTPNEFRVFSENRPNYRLCVVTCCLDRPKLYIFRFNLPSQRWTNELSEENEFLNITQKVSASVALS